MPKFKISNEYISKCNDTEISEYPKYTTQVINLSNQNAGDTRPRNVGQLAELLPEYLSSPGEASLSGWKEWYSERYPDAVNNAVDRVWDQVNNLRDCMDYIDKHITNSAGSKLGAFTAVFNHANQSTFLNYFSIRPQSHGLPSYPYVLQ